MSFLKTACHYLHIHEFYLLKFQMSFKNNYTIYYVEIHTHSPQHNSRTSCSTRYKTGLEHYTHTPLSKHLFILLISFCSSNTYVLIHTAK